MNWMFLAVSLHGGQLPGSQLTRGQLAAVSCRVPHRPVVLLSIAACVEAAVFSILFFYLM